MVFGLGKKKEVKLPPIEVPPVAPEPKSTEENVGIESLKAKIDLLATRMESLKAQSSVISERLENLEKMVKEIYNMAKSQ